MLAILTISSTSSSSPMQIFLCVLLLKEAPNAKNFALGRAEARVAFMPRAASDATALPMANVSYSLYIR